MSQESKGSHVDRKKTVRMTAAQAERLERAARVAGLRASDFMRGAIVLRCDEILGDSSTFGTVGAPEKEDHQPER